MRRVMAESINQGAVNSNANGLIEEIRKAEMVIIGVTVGRRNQCISLRPLNDDELTATDTNAAPSHAPAFVLVHAHFMLLHFLQRTFDGHKV